MKSTRLIPFLLITVSFFVTIAANAAIVVVPASKDNTIFQEGDLSNGQGESIFVGRAAQATGFSLRRGLISFDIAAFVPEGATILDVTVTMRLTTPRQNNPAVGISLHVARMDWGEGTSNSGTPGGAGAPAQTNDATWIHNFFDASEWTTPGGDFRGTASAIKSVSTPNTDYTWTSTTMVADVQSWLDDPDSNFGWFILGNESQSQTAQRFASSEADGDLGPRLTISYIPEPSAASLGIVGTCVLLRRRRAGIFN